MCIKALRTSRTCILKRAGPFEKRSPLGLLIGPQTVLVLEAVGNHFLARVSYELRP